ncbi:MAG: hypothetical protein IJ055_04630 [Oscillospiraceae bacterium]|nr:hypothetical protein [Oscillospiraceae bacterium]
MNRTKTVLGILFGVLHVLLVAAYAVILLFFRGLPVYLFLKMHPMEGTDLPVTPWPYDTAVPADFEPIITGGVTAMVPPGMYRKDPDSPIELYLNAQERTPEYCMIWGDAPEAVDEFTAFDDPVTGFAMRSYCRHRGIDPIDTEFEFLRACLTLTPEDLNIHSLSDSLMYAYLAFGKSVLTPTMEGAYTCEIGGCEGIITVIAWDDPERGSMVLCELYGGGQYGTVYRATVNAMDGETLCAVVNSLRTEEGQRELSDTVRRKNSQNPLQFAGASCIIRVCNRTVPCGTQEIQE